MAGDRNRSVLGGSTGRAALRCPSLLARAAIRIYRYSLSSLAGRTCRHLPTCSEYCEEAISRHGLWGGGWMGLARLWRCRPGGSHGFDPPPDTTPTGAIWYAPWRYGRWKSGVLSTNASPLLNDAMEVLMPGAKPAVEDESQGFRFKEPGEDPGYDAWFREQVQIGIDAANRGELIPDEVVRRQWRKTRAELLKRIKDEQ